MKYIFLIMLSSILFASECKDYKINSIFYQPLAKDSKIFQWDKKFQFMQKKGIKTLIIQWSQYGEYDFLEDKQWLGNILQKAQQHHIKVVVGLYADDKYFVKLQNKETDVENYLEELKKKNILTAQKIMIQAEQFSSFNGWYIYDEINDVHFRSKNKQVLLQLYLHKLALGLAEIKKQQVYISGYFTMAMDPRDFAKMFSYITSQEYIVLLQSGVGAGHVNLRESTIYMREFAKHFSFKFVPIVESFKLINNQVVAISDKKRCEEMDMFYKNISINEFSLFSLKYFYY